MLSVLIGLAKSLKRLGADIKPVASQQRDGLPAIRLHKALHRITLNVV